MRERQAFIREIPRILLFSLLGGVTLTYFTCMHCHHSMQDYIIVSFFSATLWFSMWIGNSLLSDFLTTKIAWTDSPVKRLTIGVLATVIFSVTTVVSLLLIWEYFFRYNFGGYYEVIITSLVLTFVVSLILHSRSFLINWKQSLISAERFKRESVAAQYESLKSQVNPHFLFNSLNALTNLVYEDPDKAARFIKQLSEVYRYVLDTRDKEVVSVEEELKFLNSYIYLQQIRFGENLKIKIDLDKVTGNVAPLALQLLVENAIKHNVVSTDDPLTITIYESDGFIITENNLQKKMVLGEDSSGLGLENIRSRYTFLSDKKVEILEHDGKFSVKLPVIEMEEA